MAHPENTIGAQSEMVLKKMAEAFMLHQRWILAITIVYTQRTGESLKPEKVVRNDGNDVRLAQKIMAAEARDGSGIIIAKTLSPGQFEQRRNGTRRTSRSGGGLVARRSRSVLRSLTAGVSQ